MQKKGGKSGVEVVAGTTSVINVSWNQKDNNRTLDHGRKTDGYCIFEIIDHQMGTAKKSEGSSRRPKSPPEQTSEEDEDSDRAARPSACAACMAVFSGLLVLISISVLVTVLAGYLLGVVPGFEKQK
ncbi:unnamed protein product [Caenorhabditis auriculariae]|uniref:Uncharacterized protein n=1 Tax=Caenorhabditis auriculariae TaxID=2777116 RepID=A0A8S1HRB8_9PELO|nr:unnamed protein product [Caenorhabditis auriculariae]